MVKIEHPGVILKKEFMASYGITADRLNQEIGIDNKTISEILDCTCAISPMVGLKLAKLFGLPERFWINLQVDYDTKKAKLEIVEELEKIQILPEIVPA